MTKEEFWEKWNPCDYSEWGAGIDDYNEYVAKTQDDMLKDLDEVAMSIFQDTIKACSAERQGNEKT